MPPEDSNSEEVVLHGNFSNFTRATEMVVNRAFSTVAQQIPAPNWLHRFIIGPKGATLQVDILSYSVLLFLFSS